MHDLNVHIHFTLMHCQTTKLWKPYSHIYGNVIKTDNLYLLWMIILQNQNT